MNRDEIINRIAKKLMGEVHVPEYDNGLIDDVLTAADFWPLVEAAEKIVKCGRHKYRCFCGEMEKLDAALAKIRGEEEKSCETCGGGIYHENKWCCLDGFLWLCRKQDFVHWRSREK